MRNKIKGAGISGGMRKGKATSSALSLGSAGAKRGGMNASVIALGRSMGKTKGRESAKSLSTGSAFGKRY